MSALNRVVVHNAADLTLAVEAGITLSSLREVLATEGQFLALDAPLPARATIGGTLAAGVSGPLKWQYGSARDLVIGMKTAQADGRITQSGGNVVKNVSGYDMARLHVGGLGTLGVITEVSFKLTPLPRHETTLLARFDSAAECMSAALGIFNSGVMPIALTAFNQAVSERIELDADDHADYSLAVRLGGRPRTLRRMENEAFFVIRERTDRVDRPEDEAGGLWAQLADFGHSEGEEAAVSARVAALPNRLDKAIEALASQGRRRNRGAAGLWYDERSLVRRECAVGGSNSWHATGLASNRRVADCGAGIAPNEAHPRRLGLYGQLDRHHAKLEGAVRPERHTQPEQVRRRNLNGNSS